MANVVATNVIRAAVEDIERLEAEAVQVDETIAARFDRAKRDGVDLKTLRNILKIRKQDPAQRAEAEALEKLYLEACAVGAAS